jgi:hypothetical protein
MELNATFNNKISFTVSEYWVNLQIPPSVSTIKHSDRTQSFVLKLSNKCPTKLSNKILPGQSESLHSQIVKL